MHAIETQASEKTPSRPAPSTELRGTHDDLLHRIVREGLPQLLGALEERGRYLPGYVLSELERFSTCQDPVEGFAHLVCPDCGHHRIVPFSCKTRGFCPCCCGRRMAERAATWCDSIIPHVPVRQWVLTLPWNRRFLFSCHPELAKGALHVVLRAIFGWYRSRGQALGIPDGKTGSISVFQRFGSALNLNLHVHSLVLDGVYARDAKTGLLRFHALAPPSQEDMEELVSTIAKRVERWLERKGHGSHREDTPMEEDPNDAQILLKAASMEGRAALGRRAGRKTRRMGQPRNPYAMPRRCAAVDGYNLHADVRVSLNDRAGLERICRYLLRPPLSRARLDENEEGDLVVQLKRAWSDGTTQIVLTRLEFLERLCALVPQPGVNQVLYHGILAAHAEGRAEIVPPIPVGHERRSPKTSSSGWRMLRNHLADGPGRNS